MLSQSIQVSILDSGLDWVMMFDWRMTYGCFFPCTVIDLVLCWCVLHAPYLSSPDVTGYAIDSKTGAWPQQDEFSLPRHLFSHLGFLECSCCIECYIYPRLCHDCGLMIFDWRMTDGYFLPYTSLHNTMQTLNPINTNTKP